VTSKTSWFREKSAQVVTEADEAANEGDAFVISVRRVLVKGQEAEQQGELVLGRSWGGYN
jgi:hypothetical protein